MKLLKKISISFILTIIIGAAILLTGNQLLAKAGLSFINNNDHLSMISTESNNSYVFYSQLNDDLTLYPWIYYSDAVPCNEYYGDSLSLLNMNEAINLYNAIRYYFYKMIPQEQKDYINSVDSSLRDIMDYEHMEPYTKIKVVNNKVIIFFERDIQVNNSTFHLAFAYRDTGAILSFQCKKLSAPDNYTADIMKNGKKYLNQFIDNSSPSYLNYMIFDMFTMSDLFQNYSLKITNDKSVDINLKTDTSKLTSAYNAYEKDEFFKNYYFSSYGTYQLVETKDELMVVLLDSNIVVHFDPINRIINGFNISE